MYVYTYYLYVLSIYYIYTYLEVKLTSKVIQQKCEYVCMYIRIILITQKLTNRAQK